jgi:hypothetical protein
MPVRMAVASTERYPRATSRGLGLVPRPTGSSSAVRSPMRTSSRNSVSSACGCRSSKSAVAASITTRPPRSTRRIARASCGSIRLAISDSRGKTVRTSSTSEIVRRRSVDVASYASSDPRVFVGDSGMAVIFASACSGIVGRAHRPHYSDRGVRFNRIGPYRASFEGGSGRPSRVPKTASNEAECSPVRGLDRRWVDVRYARRPCDVRLTAFFVTASRWGFSSCGWW